MNLLDQVSSRVGDRTQESNNRVAELCLKTPDHLDDIVNALVNKDKNLAGDCAEVLTLVAEQSPGMVAPYAKELIPCLTHKATRVRWETAHALAYIAHLSPDIIEQHFTELYKIFKEDKSIIVRDYLVDVAANYATANPDAAEQAWPLLKDSLVLWQGRHAGHAVPGLEQIARHCPEYIKELKQLVPPLLEHKKAVIRKSFNKFKQESLKGA